MKPKCGTAMPAGFSRHSVCHHVHVVERDATSSFLSSLQRGFSSRLQAFAPWVGTACLKARAQARLKPAVTQCCHNAHHRLKPVADRMPAEGRQRWVDEPHTKASINTCEDLNP